MKRVYEEPSERERERVRKGARFLDKHGPEEWRGRVDLARLEILDATKCVLGQLYGGYYEGARELGLNFFERLAYGLTAAPSEAPEVERAWREEIKEDG